MSIKGQRALSDIELEESLAKQALDRRMFSRLIPLLGPVRGRIAAVISIEVLLVFAVFLRPKLIGTVIDHGFVHAKPHWLVNESTIIGVSLPRSGPRRSFSI